MTEPSHAVFLSYASQDAEAAQRICGALRAAGIEVWLDQSELRGGDAWDESIRDQIKACALFIPVISASAHARIEGYFRLEWKLAIDRSHRMAPKQPFLLPVVIDGTPQADDTIPDRFRELQWTRLPGGQTPPDFVERVRRLISPELSHAPTTTVSPAGPVPTATLAIGATFSRPKRALLATVAVGVLGAVAYFAVDKFSKHRASPPTPPAIPASVATAAFAPPPHSIAVLPFVNMSGDKEQEYFSDGLTEEILNSLARINELQVSARTSAFSFKGKDVKIGTIARELNVGSILEGSVRRSGHTIRVTAQLNNAVTGFHLWSQTYDRDLGDVLALQTEIANAVAGALKVTLLGDEAARIELGGTRNAAAFDAYLRGSKAYSKSNEAKEVQAAIAAYTEAIRLDPNYALAFAARSLAFNDLASSWTAESAASHEAFEKAHADARKAIGLAPDLAEGHLALADALEARLDFRQANEEFERSIALAPGNAQVLRDYSDFAASMGRFDAGIAAARRAVLLDPLNRFSHAALAGAFFWARRYEEAMGALKDVLSLDPEFFSPTAWLVYYELGKFQEARVWCERRPDDWGSKLGLAIIYDKLGRRADAEVELAKLKAGNPSHDDFYQYAQVYAQWGDSAKALSSLEKALSVRHVALYYLKVDPLLDSLRKEPRFQAIERELKFP